MPRSSDVGAAARLEQAEGWEAAVLKLEESLKMARTAMGAARLKKSELRAGGAPVSPEGAGG